MLHLFCLLKPFREKLAVSKYYFIGPAIFCAPGFFIEAPFGRFSPSKPSLLLVDGIKSWIAMEIVSPICFLAIFLSSPLTRPLSSLKQFPLSPPPIYTQISLAGLDVSVPNAPTILALLYLTHYANRAIISPLRTPARSKSHIAVPICAVIFNVVNGSLMGAFLAAVATPTGRVGSGALSLRAPQVVTSNWSFWAGVCMWIIGFASNIWHDEILLDIRRKPKVKSAKRDAMHGDKRHYEIPQGGLFSLISYPNYLSEWFEWVGFAVAASAYPAHTLCALSHVVSVQKLTPAWLFLFSEVFLMLPQAWNGHKWYQRKFPNYPRERRAVIPFLL
ncbi:3-oxo-5-alpha-steroid 4-dehydrogenase-domain-containing protein [Hysterangium stoloniferum]|nr:3-oxo-5-alpha-steroid 4-dehydrogenase-domain-containing protein [Hysterangium stoloniferum]